MFIGCLGQRVALVGMFDCHVLIEFYLWDIIDIGGSGCGKSTTIQLLQRFYDVKRGQIVSISGIDDLC